MNEVEAPPDDRAQESSNAERTKHADELKKRLATIASWQDTLSRCAWKIGSELKAIRDRKLWHALVRPDGSRVYASWDEFLREEIGYSRNHAENLIRVATHYTEADVRRVGITRLVLINRIQDDKERVSFLAAVLRKRWTVARVRQEIAKKLGYLEPGIPGVDYRRRFVARLNAAGYGFVKIDGAKFLVDVEDDDDGRPRVILLRVGGEADGGAS